MTRLGQTVEVGVGRRVSPLARDTEHRTGRGRQEHEVEAARREGLVQHLGAGDLRPDRALQPAFLQLGEKLGIGDAGAVNDAADRHGTFVVALGQQSLHRLGRTDVECNGFDGHTAGLERPNGVDLLPRGGVVAVIVPVAAGRQRGAARENDPPRSAVREPTGRQQTERTQASGDQVGRVRAAAQRLAHRLAGHRHEAWCQELAVAQRQDRLRRGP